MTQTVQSQALSLLTLPPAVLQQHAAPDRSEHYSHINTRAVIGIMEAEGFEVASVQVTRSRAIDPLYARHQVVLRNRNLRTIDGVVPQFLFTNAHDGSASAQVLYGAFRFVCSNGLVVGTTFARERVRHSGKDAATQLIDRVRAMAKNTQPLFDKIDEWSRIELTQRRQRRFADLASTLRWGDPHRFARDQVLHARRDEDAKDDLWHVFNRVQENTVRGGLIGLTGSGRTAVSRPLSEIVHSNNYNAQLWQLAEEFAALPR